MIVSRETLVTRDVKIFLIKRNHHLINTWEILLPSRLKAASRKKKVFISERWRCANCSLYVLGFGSLHHSRPELGIV